MSKFSTSLPTKLDTLLKSLPINSTVHSITLNEDTHDIVVEWENSMFETGLTVPIDFPLDDLKAKLAPKGAWLPGKKKPGTLSPKAKQNAPQPVPAPKTELPVWITEAEVAAAVKAGEAVEFQGIEPRWQPFTPSDSYTKGYFYRLKKVDKVEEPVPA